MESRKQSHLILSIALGGYRKLFAPCIETHLNYCRRHNYRYALIDHLPITPTEAESAWLKLPLVLSALHLAFDWIGFIDADCEVRPFCPQIDSVARPGKYIYMAHGVTQRFNSGVIILKHDDRVKSVIETIIANAAFPVPEIDQGPYENGHVIRFCKNNDIVAKLDDRWNNTSVLDDASFIQHYSGGILRQHYLRNNTGIAYRVQNKVLQKLQRLGMKTPTQDIPRVLDTTFMSDCGQLIQKSMLI